MGFLIDTNLWIAIERGRLSAADVHAITKQAPIYLSPVNLAEIRFGLELMSNTRCAATTVHNVRQRFVEEGFAG